MARTIRYSEGFKRQVVDELERGKFESIGAASRAYGIRGSETVLNWVRKYGRSVIHPKLVRVETLQERDMNKELKQQVRDLTNLVANLQMDRALGDAFLEIACEKLNTTPEELKKKSGLTLSDVLTRKAKV